MCRPVRWIDSRGRPLPRFLSAVRTRRRRRSNRESLAILLLLPFLAEDVLAAILDALALVGLRLAPATDLGRELPDRLLVDAADLDRGLIGSLHLEAFRHIEIDIVAVAKREAQVAPLGLGTIADAGDVQEAGVAVRDAFDEVRDERALHAPVAARFLGIVSRLDRNRSILELVADLVREAEREGALRALHAERAVLDRGGDTARDLDRPFTDTAHQNTSASTSPPTFCARASLSESTPRGVETMVMP